MENSEEKFIPANSGEPCQNKDRSTCQEPCEIPAGNSINVLQSEDTNLQQLNIPSAPPSEADNYHTPITTSEPEKGLSATKDYSLIIKEEQDYLERMGYLLWDDNFQSSIESSCVRPSKNEPTKDGSYKDVAIISCVRVKEANPHPIKNPNLESIRQQCIDLGGVDFLDVHLQKANAVQEFKFTNEVEEDSGPESKRMKIQDETMALKKDGVNYKRQKHGKRLEDGVKEAHPASEKEDCPVLMSVDSPPIIIELSSSPLQVPMAGYNMDEVRNLVKPKLPSENTSNSSSHVGSPDDQDLPSPGGVHTLGDVLQMEVGHPLSILEVLHKSKYVEIDVSKHEEYGVENLNSFTMGSIGNPPNEIIERPVVCEAIMSKLILETEISPNCAALKSTHSPFHINAMFYPPAVPGAFINLTKLEVPREVEVLLSFGPKFVPPFTLNIYEIYKGLVLGCQQGFGCKYINKMAHFEPDIYYEMAVQATRYVSERTVSYVEEMLNRFYDVTKKFITMQRAPENAITLVQSDKSKCTILMYVHEYKNKMQLFVEGALTKGAYCAEIHDGYVSNGNGERLEMSIDHFHKHFYPKMLEKFKNISLRVLKELSQERKDLDLKGRVPPRLVALLRTFLSNPGKIRLPELFGNIKTHKEGEPFRPIVDTKNWITNPLQRIFLHVCQYVLREFLSHTNIGDITNVVKGVHDKMLCEGWGFYKIDFKDMYNNIPKDKAFNMIKEKLFMQSEAFMNKNSAISKNLLLEILAFNFYEGNVLSYGGHLYRQVIGLPQGAPDSGFLATLYLDVEMQFMSHALNRCHEITLEYKYMDDVLVYGPLDKLESYSKNLSECVLLELTTEKEELIVDNLLGECMVMSYLDVEIMVCKSTSKLYTRIYRKPHSSNRTINYYSNQPDPQKKATIGWFFRRVYTHTSNEFLQNGIDSIFVALQENSYPMGHIIPLFLQSAIQHLMHLNQGQLPFSMTGREVAYRFWLLENYMNQFGYRVNKKSFHEEQTEHNTKGYLHRNLRPFHPLPYLCAEFSGFMDVLYKQYQLGTPVYRNDNTMLRLLNTCMRRKSTVKEKDYNMKKQRRMRYYVASCRNCSMLFLLGGSQSAMQILEDCMLNTQSMIFHHIDFYKHEINLHMYELSEVGEMSDSEKMSFYLLLYRGLGINCGDSRSLHNLPNYLNLLVHAFYDVYPPNVDIPQNVFKPLSLPRPEFRFGRKTYK